MRPGNLVRISGHAYGRAVLFATSHRTDEHDPVCEIGPGDVCIVLAVAPLEDTARGAEVLLCSRHGVGWVRERYVDEVGT